MGYRDAAAPMGNEAEIRLERWASAGRTIRVVEGERAITRIGTGHDVDPRETGLSWPEALVGSLWGASVLVLLLGLRLLGTSGALPALVLAVPLWLLSVALSIPVFGGIAVFRGAERRFVAALPLVIDGYLELLERARLVRSVRLRLHFAEGVPVDVEWLREVFLGANVGGDLRREGLSGALFVYCRIPRSRALAVRRWFRALLMNVLMPLHQARGLRRVDVEEV